MNKCRYCNAYLGANLTHVDWIVIAFLFCVFVNVKWIFPRLKKQTEMILDVNNSFKLKTFLTERRTVPKANSKRQPLVKSTTPFSRPCYVKVGGQSSPLLSNLPINSLWSRYLLIAGILVEHKSQNIFPPNRDLNPNFWIDSPKC